MKPRIARRRGYTVIELLFVMIIIGVIVGITFVQMAPTLGRARVRGAASVLAGDLQYAQVMAARLRTPMVVSVDTAALTYQIADRSGTVIRTRDFAAKDYALTEMDASPASLEVFPNAVAAQNATYTVGANGYRRRVTFSRAGQIRVSTVP
jgi:prepilin-type N-terminal cleavage/methylation domain-containing protein